MFVFGYHLSPITTPSNTHISNPPFHAGRVRRRLSLSLASSHQDYRHWIVRVDLGRFGPQAQVLKPKTLPPLLSPSLLRPSSQRVRPRSSPWQCNVSMTGSCSVSRCFFPFSSSTYSARVLHCISNFLAAAPYHCKHASIRSICLRIRPDLSRYASRSSCTFPRAKSRS